MRSVNVIDDLIYLVGGRTGQWGYMTFMYPSALCEQYLPVDYIPEFPSWTPLLSTLVAVVTVAMIYRRRLHNQNQRGKKIKI